MTAKTRRAAHAQGPMSIDFAVREGGAPRHMNVRIPSPEQLAVWQSIGEQFTRLGVEWEHQSAAVADLAADHPDVIGVRVTQNKQAVRGINRGIKLIKSILVDESDHEWVDDAIMDGATLERMLGIVSAAVDEMRKRAAANGAPVAASATKGKAALSE